MKTGDTIYLETDPTPGRRSWLVGTVVSTGKVWVTVAVELDGGGTERVRVKRSDVVREGTQHRGNVR